MTIEERIKELERSAKDIERLSMTKKSEEESQDIVRSMATQNAISAAAKRLGVIMRNERDGTIALSAKSLFGPRVFKHSALGSTRAISSSINYYQTSGSDIRGGQRFIDRFVKRFVGTNETLRYIYPTPSGAANDVGEGAPKPQRQYSFTPTDIPFGKLAVTDTITQEIVLADSGERAANFIIDALVEHVKDELNNRFINYLVGNGAAFNPALWAGYLNIPSGTARWHDLVTAAQLQFEQSFADHMLDIKYGDILVVPFPVYLGILQDRKGNGSELYYDVSPLSNLSLSSIWKRYSGAEAVLTHTEAVLIDLVDDIQVYYNRVVDAANDTNISRVTVEVFYRFVPVKQPLPAVVLADPRANLGGIAP